MSVTITTTDAPALLKRLRDYIDQDKSRTWQHKGNRFSQPNTDLAGKGELEASVVGGNLVLLVKHPPKMSRSDALLLETRFARFALDHAQDLTEEACVSSKPKPGDEILNPVASALRSFKSFL